MDNSAVLNLDHHRSRDRIKHMGEVFTPEKFVNELLKQFDPKVWSDENVIIFEPTAGHGNIILPVLDKRIDSLFGKFQKNGERDAALCAIATALNTFWAMDICPLNVERSRERTFALVIQKFISFNKALETQKSKDFLVHVLCTISWQIQENEALSALSKPEVALSNGSRTKLGASWIKSRQHKPISFQDDWCAHFKSASKENVVPILFERASRFVENASVGDAGRGFNEFKFAKLGFEIALATLENRTSGVA